MPLEFSNTVLFVLSARFFFFILLQLLAVFCTIVFSRPTKRWIFILLFSVFHCIAHRPATANSSEQQWTAATNNILCIYRYDNFPLILIRLCLLFVSFVLRLLRRWTIWCVLWVRICLPKNLGQWPVHTHACTHTQTHKNNHDFDAEKDTINERRSRRRINEEKRQMKKSALTRLRARLSSSENFRRNKLLLVWRAAREKEFTVKYVFRAVRYTTA